MPNLLSDIGVWIAQNYIQAFIFIIVVVIEELILGLFTRLMNFLRRIISYKYRFYKKFKEDTIIFTTGATSPTGVMQAKSTFYAPMYSMGIGDAFALSYILKIFDFLKVTPEINMAPKNIDDQDFRLKRNIICIGGPASNTVTEVFKKNLNKKNFKWDQPYSEYIINGKRIGGIQEGDIGIMLRAKNPLNKNTDILIVAGIGDYGTAAAGAISQSEKIKEVYKKMKKSKDNSVVALIRGRIYFNEDRTWKLDDYDIESISPL
jgi:hypothetical protein